MYEHYIYFCYCMNCSFFFSDVCKIRGLLKLQYMGRQKPFQSTHNSDGTRYFLNLLDMWSPTEVSIDCRAKKVIFCHSSNWL